MPSSADVDTTGEVTAGDGRLAWVALATVLAIGASAAFLADTTTALDWQPSLALQAPWRAWTAAWVHYSAMHLVANLVGCLLVAWFGVAARVPARTVVAWFVAWPLTQAGLLLRPDLLHYGGLSGVLHAGAAAAATHLVVAARGTRRFIGIGVLSGVAIKVLMETPWGEALRHPAGWDIAVAPFAHVCGLVAGAGLAALAEVLGRPLATIERND